MNAKLKNEETALHVAAKSGFDDVVVLLLRENADPKVRNLKGETAFHAAVLHCHYEIARSILEHIENKWSKSDANTIVASANRVSVRSLMEVYLNFTFYLFVRRGKQHCISLLR